MTSWQQFSDEAPELAQAIGARFTATKHHVLATLRADGSPRVSGTEVRVYRDQLTLGSMWQARKALDLQRDGRFALHANPGDGSMTGGDAKISGHATEVTDAAELAAYFDNVNPPEPSHLFRLELHDATLTTVDEEAGILYVRTWRPGEEVRVFERR
jgi:hypothetical protein